MGRGPNAYRGTVANVLNPQAGGSEHGETDREGGSDHPGRTAPGAALPLLSEPRDGLPAVVADDAALARLVERVAAGHGPVAVDAERASGYRYTQRAYLVQLRRAGAGSALVDPVPCPDLSALGAAVADTEVVLHAAHQDLPCLAELGLRPARLFDTELAGRLLGYPRVGLGSMVERFLGVRLAKEHAAVDWSTRPLPSEWLRYAVLDVEPLVELRDALAEELAAAGKLGWAEEEFAAVLTSPPKEPRPDPWRRTSGIHQVRSQRSLAAVRELWLERDRIAREQDLAPGRVLPDAAIVAIALAMPRTAREVNGLKPLAARQARRHVPEWLKAVERARTMPPSEFPQPTVPGDGPPPTSRWADRDPPAARRLDAVRATVRRIADEVTMPVENLLQPDTVRRLAWAPPTRLAEETVADHLRAHHAREWQVTLTARALATAMREA